MASDDIAVLGAANMQSRSRTNAAGATKNRYSVSVSGDSILINTDPKSIGKPVAEAIAELLRERVGSISERASDATLRARKVAAKAFADGKTWATKRYGGGKIGAMAPNQSDRKFNDSGRLVKSIGVRGEQEQWSVYVAANRFAPDTLKDGIAGLARMFDDLKRLVPEFGDPRKMMDSIPVRRAVNAGIASAIIKAGEKRVELERARMQAGISLVKQLLSSVA